MPQAWFTTITRGGVDWIWRRKLSRRACGEVQSSSLGMLPPLAAI
jgi:hypothetical protein